MANFHSVSFALAGSRETINQAILLMGRNIAESTGIDIVEFDDLERNYREIEPKIDSFYSVSFAGKKTEDRCLSETASVTLIEKGENFCLQITYDSANRLNRADMGFFLESLSEMSLSESCSFEVCVLHGDEYDGYDELTCEQISVGKSKDWEESSKCFTAGDLALMLRESHSVGCDGGDDPRSLAQKTAFGGWCEWRGESVRETLRDAGMFGDMDEGEVEDLMWEYSYEIIDLYVRGEAGPVDRMTLEECGVEEDGGSEEDEVPAFEWMNPGENDLRSIEHAIFAMLSAFPLVEVIGYGFTTVGREAAERLFPGDPVFMESDWASSETFGQVQFALKDFEGNTLCTLCHFYLTNLEDSRETSVLLACLLPHLRVTIWDLKPGSLRSKGCNDPEMTIRFDLEPVDVEILINEVHAIFEKPLAQRTLSTRKGE